MEMEYENGDVFIFDAFPVVRADCLDTLVPGCDIVSLFQKGKHKAELLCWKYFIQLAPLSLLHIFFCEHKNKPIYFLSLRAARRKKSEKQHLCVREQGHKN